MIGVCGVVLDACGEFQPCTYTLQYTTLHYNTLHYQHTQRSNTTTGTGSFRDLHTSTDPNTAGCSDVVSFNRVHIHYTTLHYTTSTHRGATQQEQGPLKISTPLRTQTQLDKVNIYCERN